MTTHRLFVALLPPATVCAELAALASRRLDVRWVPLNNFHLTMRFIGETEPERLEKFADALMRVRVEPFILPVEGVGVFPTRGPAKVLWAGVGQAHTRLFQLRKQVDEALLAVDSGLEMKNFHPHFTLGRLGETTGPKELESFLVRNKAFEAPPFRVSEFHLMASLPRRADDGERPQSSGETPAYRSVQAFALQGK